MRRIATRLLEIDLPHGRSAFLWGPRGAGKTYWLQQHFSSQSAWIIDLENAEVLADYRARPELLRERWSGKLTVIDEVQRAPVLLTEVDWLIENRGASFVLSASSARTLRWGRAGLLSGQARRIDLGPLSCLEVEGFDLEGAMRSGMLPAHFLSEQPEKDLHSYVVRYLEDECAAELSAQDLAAFMEFLRFVALTGADLPEYASVAREGGVSGRLARKFYEILEDTLLCFRVKPWTAMKNRHLFVTDRLYFCDVGIANHLAARRPVAGGAAFAKSFEHYLLIEVMNYRRYRAPDLELRGWRTGAGLEVPCVLGEMDAALSFVARENVQESDLIGLRALCEERRVGRPIAVSLEREGRVIAGVEVLPWRAFLQQLHAGDLVR